MASWTMAFEGFSVESSDSLEADVLFFIFSFAHAVQQDIQLPAAPFFMFDQNVFYRPAGAHRGPEAEIEVVHIGPEILRHPLRGQAGAHSLAFQQPCEHREIQPVKVYMRKTAKNTLSEIYKSLPGGRRLLIHAYEVEKKACNFPVHNL